MQKDGIIISNASNLYIVEDVKTNEIIKCNARGKFKEQDRKNYIKRPKMANLTQIIFVVSMSKPKPDLLMLDKQLAFAELNNIKPVICLNKIDLVDEEAVNKIEKIYSEIGYKIFKTNK